MKLLMLLFSTVFVFASVNMQYFSNQATTPPKAQISNSTAMTSQSSDKVSKADAEKKVGDLRGLKNLVDGYKNLLKDKYRNDDQDAAFIEAAKSYINANAVYEKYLGSFLEAIRDGNQKNLLKDPDFNKTGEEVRRLSMRFVSLADSLTSERAAETSATANKRGGAASAEKGGMTSGFGITDVVSAAITVWKAWKDDQRKERNDKADRLRNELSWNPWNPTPAPTASPKQSPKP